MAKLTKEEFINSLNEMSILEIKELVDAMKEAYGVDPSAVAVAGPAVAAVEEGPSKVNVVLTAAGANKIAVIKLDEYLEGPSAISFSSDELAPVKIISDFAKKHTALELKAGIVEGKVVAADELSVYAAIPSREGLLTMLAAGLMGTVKDLSICLDLYAKQKEEN